MGNLVNAPYAVQAVALWAIEYAYNQGWQLPGKMPPPYDEFADRWGNVGFTEYVQSLARQADAALQVATPEAIAKAQQVFLRVVALERDFWQMAYDAT
jgi:thiaminase/transcriptional activator TenA